MLVDRPVRRRPPPGDLDVRLIGEPPVTRSMPTQPRRLDELGSEALDPPVHGHVVNGDAPLGQQLLDVPVGQAMAQVPADREGDHLSRKPEAGEHGEPSRRRYRTSLPPAAIGQRNTAARPRSRPGIRNKRNVLNIDGEGVALCCIVADSDGAASRCCGASATAQHLRCPNLGCCTVADVADCSAQGCQWIWVARCSACMSSVVVAELMTAITPLLAPELAADLARWQERRRTDWSMCWLLTAPRAASVSPASSA